jgi:hypothetical protein
MKARICSLTTGTDVEYASRQRRVVLALTTGMRFLTRFDPRPCESNRTRGQRVGGEFTRQQMAIGVSAGDIESRTIKWIEQLEANPRLVGCIRDEFKDERRASGINFDHRVHDLPFLAEARKFVDVGVLEFQEQSAHSASGGCGRCHGVVVGMAESEAVGIEFVLVPVAIMLLEDIGQEGVAESAWSMTCGRRG